MQIRRFQVFCHRFNFPHLHPSPAQLTLYLEYLAQNLRSSQSVKNYLSAVSYIHKQLGLECTALQSHQVITMIRAIDHTLRSPLLPTVPISLQVLYSLVTLCNQLGTWGLVCKCAFLFCFFGFLRQSNVAPRSPQLFDSSRDTCRSDVKSTQQGLSLRLKWTKTNQGAHHPHIIPLPRIQGSVLCPTTAFQDMCSAVPSISTNTPLLIHGHPPVVVTTRLLAKQFKQLILRLRLNPATHTLHSLRKGGATLALSVGITVDQIKAHGTWSSSSVWTYLKPNQIQLSSITHAMAQAARSAHHKP